MTLIRNKDSLKVEIEQKVPTINLLLILLWFVLVFIAGILIFPDFLRLKSSWNIEKTIYSVMLAAWIFFLFKIGKILIWRYIGREVIIFTGKELTINNMYGTIGKPQKFKKKEIKKFKEYTGANSLLKKYINYEFLTTGGEKFEFAYNNNEYIFGKMLTESESKILEHIFRKEIQKK